MSDKPLTKREKNVRRHNVATLLALLSFLTVAVNSLPGVALPLPLNVVAVLIMFVAIIVMFATRNADEYVAAIWRSGTSAAFVLTAAVVVFAPFFEGMYDGFMGNERNRDMDLSGATTLVVIGSFFIANGWTRFRGTI